jgi:hypothetical protein
MSRVCRWHVHCVVAAIDQPIEKSFSRERRRHVRSDQENRGAGGRGQIGQVVAVQQPAAAAGGDGQPREGESAKLTFGKSGAASPSWSRLEKPGAASNRGVFICLQHELSRPPSTFGAMIARPHWSIRR